MLPPNTNHDALEQFFEDYRSALQSNDTGSLMDNFHFPLTFHDAERTVMVGNAEEAEKAFLLLRRFYEDLGMACLETRFLVPQRISRDFVSVDIVWRLQDSGAMMICDQRSTFIVRDGADGTKIVTVIHHEDSYPRYGHA